MTQLTVGQAMQLALGNHRAGKLADAEGIYRRVLAQQPDHADALHLLGVLSHQVGRLDAAIELMRRAIAINPTVADYHNNLGNALRNRGLIDEAIAAYRQALSLRDDFAEAYNNLGNALRVKGQPNEAIDACRHALRIKSDYADAHNNLGNALSDQGLLDEAVAAYREAIRHNPGLIEAHNNLGSTLREKGLLDEAIDAYRQAVQLKPDDANAHHNLANALLLKGDFARGLPEFEWRWRWKGFTSPQREFSQPRWDGSDLAGRTILLHAEQGLGDTIQLARYVAMVAVRGGKVVVECQPALVRLLRGLEGDPQIVPAGDPLPSFDVHCPLGSLPLLFTTRLESIPAGAGYLKPDSSLVEAWKQNLGKRDGRLRAGLVWAGNPEFKGDRTRSLTLEQLAPLAAVLGISLFSFQKGPAQEQANHPPRGMNLIDLAPKLQDFADTAAAMSLMDLIITTDTSAPHLAGALGRPVWLMLQFVPHFCWLLKREDSPWYPTMRLFRQNSIGDWPEVIDRVAKALPAFR